MTYTEEIRHYKIKVIILRRVLNLLFSLTSADLWFYLLVIEIRDKDIVCKCKSSPGINIWLIYPPEKEHKFDSNSRHTVFSASLLPLQLSSLGRFFWLSLLALPRGMSMSFTDLIFEYPNGKKCRTEQWLKLQRSTVNITAHLYLQC